MTAMAARLAKLEGKRDGSASGWLAFDCPFNTSEAEAAAFLATIEARAELIIRINRFGFETAAPRLRNAGGGATYRVGGGSI